MAIPTSFIQELVARADVVDVVGRHVQLKKGGANFMGLCPFHGEKSPSFSVSPTKQFYHCFGCGKNGNVLSFMMEFQGMSFMEAVKDLAQSMGMQVPEDERSPQDRARDAQMRTRQASLTDVLEKAAEGYRKQLKASERGVNYFKGRGLSGEIALKYGLGYAPEGYRFLAGVFPDYDDPLLVESGMVIERLEDENDPTSEKRKYDRFRDRVMFPIRNVKGETIGFGGRVLDKGEPKYLNSPETPVFSKGRELYGLFEARESLQKAGYVLVTEGYMDVVALAQLGFPNAVATLGTACTPDHVQKLFRFTDSVVFSFDGDGAGQRASIKALNVAIPFATDTRSVKFLTLPKEHDPDSYIREHGTEAFLRFVGSAKPLSVALIDAARDGLEMDTAEGRSHFASNAKPMWLSLPEGTLKTQLIRKIAELVEINERTLFDSWKPSEQNDNKNSSGNAVKGKVRDGVSRSFVDQVSYRKAIASGVPASRFLGARNELSPIDRILKASLLEGIWEQLTNDDHSYLCALPNPHGEVFCWLDSQYQDHGYQPWAALMIGLVGKRFEKWVKTITAVEIGSSENMPVGLEGVQILLKRLYTIEEQKQLTELTRAGNTDINAYKAIAEHWKKHRGG